jgi:Animal haem peroxidase
MESRGEGHHLRKLTKCALEFRSLDGTQNNLTQPDLNYAGTEFARVGPANFADGFLYPRGDGPCAH